jgi:hypothetical protein
MEWKLSSWENSKSFLTHPKQKFPVEHCPALPELVQNSKTAHRNLHLDFVRHPRTLSGFWIWAQWLDSWENFIYTHPSLMALHSWSLLFPLEQAHILYSKRPNPLSPRASIPSSCLWIEWSKNLSFLCDSLPQAHLGCWIFILHAYYSWSLPPRLLEVALEISLCVVSLGKLVLPIVVIVSSSRSSWWPLERGKCWERSGFLWTPQRGCMILCGFEIRD